MSRQLDEAVAELIEDTGTHAVYVDDAVRAPEPEPAES